MANQLLITSILSILISFVHSQLQSSLEYTNSSTVINPTDKPFDINDIDFGHCGTSRSDSFKFLQDAQRPFCLKFYNAATTTGILYYYLGIRVDRHTLAAISGSNLGETAGASPNNTINWRSEKDVWVVFEAGGLSTTPKLARKWNAKKKIYHVFTQMSVVIVLEQGKVYDLVWDEGCNACTEKSCIEGNCAISQNSCQAGTNKCDFSIYVSWYGSDGNGRYLLTAGQRLGMFSAPSAQSYYNYVKNNLDTDLIVFPRIHLNMDKREG